MKKYRIDINKNWPYQYIVSSWSERFNWTAERGFKTLAEAEAYIDPKRFNWRTERGFKTLAERGYKTLAEAEAYIEKENKC